MGLKTAKQELPALQNYEILEKIGTGSMATVYRGRHRDSDELVRSASSLIRNVHSGAPDSIAIVMYSIMLRSASRCSWASMAQGSRVISRTTDSHEASWPGVSHNSACSSARGSSTAVIPGGYHLQPQYSVLQVT